MAIHLGRTDADAAAAFAAASPEARLEACAIVREKAQTVIEVWPLISFLFTDPPMDETAWRKVMKPEVEAVLRRETDVVAASNPFDAETLERDLRVLIDAEGLSAGKALQPIRVAITGSTISPGIFESLAALGRETSIERLVGALGQFQEGPAEAGGSQG